MRQQRLVLALVTSRLDYCNSVLHNLPSCEIKKIQGVQNMAARLIYLRLKVCRITPLLKEFHWPTVTYRIQFEILVITFKVLHGMASTYLEDVIRPCNNPQVPTVFKFPVSSPRRHLAIDHFLYPLRSYGTAFRFL